MYLTIVKISLIVSKGAFIIGFYNLKTRNQFFILFRNPAFSLFTIPYWQQSNSYALSYIIFP